MTEVLGPLRQNIDRSPGLPVIRSKGKRKSSITRLPDSFVPDFVEHMDLRSRTARALVRRIREIEAHSIGGAPAAPLRRSLIRRYVWLEVLGEAMEAELAQGKTISLGSYTQIVFALSKLAVQIGTDLRVKVRPDIRYTHAPRVTNDTDWAAKAREQNSRDQRSLLQPGALHERP